MDGRRRDEIGYFPIVLCGLAFGRADRTVLEDQTTDEVSCLPYVGFVHARYGAPPGLGGQLDKASAGKEVSHKGQFVLGGDFLITSDIGEGKAGGPGK